MNRKLCAFLLLLCVYRPPSTSASCVDYGLRIHWLGYNPNLGLGPYETDATISGSIGYVLSNLYNTHPLSKSLISPIRPRRPFWEAWKCLSRRRLKLRMPLGSPLSERWPMSRLLTEAYTSSTYPTPPHPTSSATSIRPAWPRMSRSRERGPTSPTTHRDSKSSISRIHQHQPSSAPWTHPETRLVSR